MPTTSVVIQAIQKLSATVYNDCHADSTKHQLLLTNIALTACITTHHQNHYAVQHHTHMKIYDVNNTYNYCDMTHTHTHTYIHITLLSVEAAHATKPKNSRQFHNRTRPLSRIRGQDELWYLCAVE